VLIDQRRGCRQCVMVGDQQQLAATVFSEEARAAQYDRSLFQRLVEIGHPYIMLDTQYRMHPAISAYPSRAFYEGHLKDGDNVTVPNYLPQFLSRAGVIPSPSASAGAVFRPFMFFNVPYSREVAGGSGSQSNPEEAQFCWVLISALQEAAHRAGCTTLGSIGVITFYSDQLSELRKALRVDRLNSNTSSKCAVQDIELNTIDAFQGKEMDLIIISAVRANPEGRVGFLRDLRRINVGLTRARKGLFVVGHAQTLSSNATWKGLLDQAVASKVLVEVPNSSCDVLGLLGARWRASPPIPPQTGPRTGQPHTGNSTAAVASAGGGRKPNGCASQQNAAPAAPSVDAGTIIVSTDEVKWVAGDAGASAPVQPVTTGSTVLVNWCKDRDYSVADKLASATHALHKRKRDEAAAEDGEVEE
jgi:hypothetical protein